MSKLFFIVIIYYFSIAVSNGQNNQDSLSGHKLHYEVVNGDTVAIADFENVILYPPPVFKSKKDEMKYWRLIYNLKIVYPYAKVAGNKFKEMNQHFLTLKTEHERKIYTKQVEKDIRKQFEAQLVDLTITQGQAVNKTYSPRNWQDIIRPAERIQGRFFRRFLANNGPVIRLQS